MLRLYISDPSHVIDFKPLRLDKGLNYEEEPVQIVDREVKTLRNREIALVKVLWQSHQLEEATWEREVKMMSKYLSSSERKVSSANLVYLSEAFEDERFFLGEYCKAHVLGPWPNNKRRVIKNKPLYNMGAKPLGGRRSPLFLLSAAARCPSFSLFHFSSLSHCHQTLTVLQPIVSHTTLFPFPHQKTPAQHPHCRSEGMPSSLPEPTSRGLNATEVQCLRRKKAPFKGSRTVVD